MHVTPSSASRTRYNTIGKSTWKEMGQEITWELEVPQDGYYCLAFKAKQSDKANSYSVRSMTIDGAPPFKEAEEIKFPYSSKWYVHSLAGETGEPMKVYLTAGRHVLGLSGGERLGTANHYHRGHVGQRSGDHFETADRRNICIPDGGQRGVVELIF